MDGATTERAAAAPAPPQLPIDASLGWVGLDSTGQERRGASPELEVALDSTASVVVRPIRLLVVDDHEVVRRGLLSLLDRRAGFRVVAEAGTAADAMEAIRRHRPDLVVMDVCLPDRSGIEVAREIRAGHPSVRVVILTSYPDEETVFASIAAGASAYLLKQIRGRELANALRAVADGGWLLDPAAAARVRERVCRSSVDERDGVTAGLNRREQRILRLVAEGKTNREIASEVGLSYKTVKNYVSSILLKLGLRRRAHAAAFVARHGLPDT